MDESIQINKVAKLGCILFILYVVWFKYAVREMNLILYGSVAVAAGCMLIDLWFYQKDLLKIVPIGVLMNLVMAVYSLITGMWVAKNPDMVVSLVKTYSAFSMVCIVICYISKIEGSIDWMVNVLIGVDILCAFTQMFRGVPYKGYGYVLGPMQNPNSLGVIMDIGLFCLAYKSSKDTKRLPLYIAIAILFIYSIINSGSRKSLLAVAIICGLWLIPMFSRIWKTSDTNTRALLMVAAFVIVAGAVLYFTTVFMKTDIYKRIQLLGDDSEFSSRNRKLYYYYALDYWAESPIIGIGLGQFQYWNPYHQMSHSTYAEAISCWGLVGCLLYFAPVVSAMYQAVCLSFSGTQTFLARIVLAVLAMEAFLGVGQVWFYEIEHLITWTIVYYVLSDLVKENEAPPRRVCKYVRA